MKWAGGKRWQVPHLLPLWRPHSRKRLVEPFCGGLAVTLGLSPDLFEALVSTMPWRDLPTEADKSNVRSRFEALTTEEAQGIFELWRTHAFRRRVEGQERVA